MGWCSVVREWTTQHGKITMKLHGPSSRGFCRLVTKSKRLPYPEKGIIKLKADHTINVNM